MNEVVVWNSELDRRFLCKVVKTEEYRGKLYIIDLTDNSILLEEPTNISYNALFGPDFHDVLMWEDRCIELVDGLKEKDVE
jgi:hypothetical protein